MYNCLFVFNIKVEIQSLGLWVNEKLTSNLFCTIATTVNIRLLSLIISRRANSNLIWYIGTCTTNLCRSVFVPQTINWNHNSALDLLYTFIVYSKIRCSQSFLKAFVARPSWRDFSPSREPLRVPVDSESFRTGRYRCDAFYTRKHYTFECSRLPIGECAGFRPSVIRVQTTRYYNNNNNATSEPKRNDKILSTHVCTASLRRTVVQLARASAPRSPTTTTRRVQHTVAHRPWGQFVVASDSPAG